MPGQRICLEVMSRSARSQTLRGVGRETVSQATCKPLMDGNDRPVVLLNLLFTQRHCSYERDVKLCSMMFPFHKIPLPLLQLAL